MASYVSLSKTTVFVLAGNDGGPPQEVYDVLGDPGETTDLASTPARGEAIAGRVGVARRLLGPLWPYWPLRRDAVLSETGGE